MEDNLDQAVVETTVVEAPVEGTPEPQQAVELAPDPKDRAALIRDQFDKANNRGRHAAFQNRGDGGKFAAGKVQSPVAQSEPVEIPLPKSLKREYEQHWQQTPAELRKALAEREEAFNRGLERLTEYKTQAEQAQEILREFEPYQWILRNEQTTPAKAVSALLRTAAVLRTGTPVEKAQAVAQVMQQYQIPMQTIAQMANGQAMPMQDPYLSQLSQQIQQLQAERQMERDQIASQTRQRALTEVERFAADPKNAHFEKVQDTMLALLQSPGVLGLSEWASERDKLQAAYDAAIRLNPELAPQATQQRNIQQVRRAAVQVSGSPSGGTQPLPVDVKDRRALIKNAMSRFN